MNKKILIFDDDTVILEVVSLILEDAGHEVIISETSHDILDKVAQHKPDVILMDNWIPNIGGVEATKLLKSHAEFRTIPVIYVTANSDISALAQEAQADDYIAKPFNLDDLENKVNQYLD